MTNRGKQMKTRHDLFVRAYAVSAEQNKKARKTARKSDELKWPQYALVFDTETRITADQSLTFGVYRLCELKNERYKLIREGIFYADDRSRADRRSYRRRN